MYILQSTTRGYYIVPSSYKEWISIQCLSYRVPQEVIKWYLQVIRRVNFHELLDHIRHYLFEICYYGYRKLKSCAFPSPVILQLEFFFLFTNLSLPFFPKFTLLIKIYLLAIFFCYLSICKYRNKNLINIFLTSKILQKVWPKQINP
jgi:hypothetical protein